MKRLAFFVSVLVAFGMAVSAAPTTIKYAFWGNPDAIGVEKDIIDTFEAKNPDVKVTPIAVAYNDYHAKLLIMIAGGQAPDVMRVDSYFFQDFMKNKALKDITGLIKTNKFDTSKLYSVGLQDVQSGGKFYGLPWGTAPLYMFLNKKMFADAGIPLPANKWTYDDLVVLAKKLAKGEGENQQWGFGFYLGEINGILPFVWGVGGDLFDKTRTMFTMTDKAVTNRLDDVLITNVKNGAFTSPFTFQKADDIMRYFSQNKVAMMMGSAATILSLQKIDGCDFAVAPFPGTAKVPAVTVYKSNIVGLSANTKQEKAAWKFLAFLRGPEGEKLYMKAKRMAPTYDDQVYWDLYVDTTKPPAKVKEITQEISAKYGRILPLRAGWMEVQSIVMNALQKVVAGQATSAQAMSEAAPKVQAVIK
jgi:multiple sugar transport system substrate-binding protein